MPKAKPEKDEKERLVPVWGDGITHVINGQTAVFIASPFPQYPGGVWVPYELSPRQFDAWHKAVMARQKSSQDVELFALDYWPERFTFFLAFEIENLPPECITPDGMDFPSMPLLTWLISIGTELITGATSFPNLPAPLTGGANGNGNG